MYILVTSGSENHTYGIHVGNQYRGTLSSTLGIGIAWKMFRP